MAHGRHGSSLKVCQIVVKVYRFQHWMITERWKKENFLAHRWKYEVTRLLSGPVCETLSCVD
jgi:hypothetical protein